MPHIPVSGETRPCGRDTKETPHIRENNYRYAMFQKTLTGFVRPGRLTAPTVSGPPNSGRRLPGSSFQRLIAGGAIAAAVGGAAAAAAMSVALPAQAEESSREVRRYGGESDTGASSGGACLRLLRRRGVVFTRIDDKIPSRNGGCGYRNAVRVTAIGSVRFRRPIKVRCELAARLEWWLRERVQPAAVQTFGQPIREIDSYNGYSCRNAFGLYGGRRVRRLSQHGKANALDIGGFVLENGEKIDYQVHWKKSVPKAKGVETDKVVRGGTPRGPLRGWRAKYDRRKDPLFHNKDYFLRKISFAACSIFNKVFTPDYDYHHRHHIHIDLASARLCGYASPRNYRMTAAADVPKATGGAGIALAAFRNTTVKFKDRSISFVTRNITRRFARSGSGRGSSRGSVGDPRVQHGLKIPPRQRMTMISATEDRYTGPDRGALAKAKARQAAEAREAAARKATGKKAEKAAPGKRVQIASRPAARKSVEDKTGKGKAKGSGLGRVLGILLGRRPVEKEAPETKVASRTSGADSASGTSGASVAGIGTAAGPVVGLGKSGGRVTATPRLRGAGQAPAFVALSKRASVLLD